MSPQLDYDKGKSIKNSQIRPISEVPPVKLIENQTESHKKDELDQFLQAYMNTFEDYIRSNN